jgi:Ca-activated chloride channel homolog
MKTGLYILLCLTAVFASASLHAQGGRKHIREGNRQYNQENFSQSELEYRKALEQNRESKEGKFNLGTAMYRQEKFDEAAKIFSEVPSELKDPASKAAFYHNLGNSFLQGQQIQESIEAYKEALRHNPADAETKYNLAYAQKLLNEQQEQQQNQDQNQDKDNQDQQKDDQKQEDQEDKENQQDKQDQNGNEDKQDEQQQQQRPDRISREDAERLLQAVENEEKNVQDKLKKEQVKGQKVRVIRNW